MDARAGADIHDVVCGAHGILVMLDDDDRVADISELFQRREQLIVIPLVQTDGRLVKDIEHAHQGGADLGRQTDALAFAAGESRRSAGQSQIAQSDGFQNVQTGSDLVEDLSRDHAVAVGDR